SKVDILIEEMLEIEWMVEQFAKNSKIKRIESNFIKAQQIVNVILKEMDNFIKKYKENING
ncbi:hypothetical protein LCGC14_1802420, partial [marine sediment metagenome]